MSRALVAGLMSGTSLDGVDAVLLDPDAKPRVLAHAYQAFDAALRAELLALNASGTDELARAARCANQLARHYAQAVRAVLAAAAVAPGDVRAIGCHGQTVRHRPDAGYTLQLGNPALLAELAGIAVIADFRSRDVAAVTGTAEAAGCETQGDRGRLRLRAAQLHRMHQGSHHLPCGPAAHAGHLAL